MLVKYTVIHECGDGKGGSKIDPIMSIFSADEVEFTPEVGLVWYNNTGESVTIPMSEEQARKLPIWDNASSHQSLPVTRLDLSSFYGVHLLVRETLEVKLNCASDTLNRVIQFLTGEAYAHNKDLPLDTGYKTDAALTKKNVDSSFDTVNLTIVSSFSKETNTETASTISARLFNVETYYGSDLVELYVAEGDVPEITTGEQECNEAPTVRLIEDPLDKYNFAKTKILGLEADNENVPRIFEDLFSGDSAHTGKYKIIAPGLYSEDLGEHCIHHNKSISAQGTGDNSAMTAF